MRPSPRKMTKTLPEFSVATEIEEDPKTWRRRFRRRGVALGKRVSPDPFGDRAATEPRLSHDVADGSSFPMQRTDPIKQRLP